MKILAIDTATEACSAALLLDGEVHERFEVQPRKHGQLILGMMDGLLAEAGLALPQLDALAFGRGPGAFTGVRIATGVAQGAAFGAELPLLPISTLAALAQRHCRETGAQRILAAFDARMGELYWGAYRIDDSGLARLLGEEQVAAPDALQLPPGDGWHGVGSGWGTYAEALAARLGDALVGTNPELLSSAHDVALLAVAAFREGQGVPAEQGLPVYLRDRVAWKKVALTDRPRSGTPTATAAKPR
jgi:tRNA threonylcarbamoyladenosine biosynthesis protein TsaB